MVSRAAPRWLGVILAGAAGVALLVALFAPSQTNDAGAVAVATTPTARFDQLVSQLSTAAEQGDAALAKDVADEALRMFDAIPLAERDVDRRYHVAMMRAVAGDGAGALAQADTIFAVSPSNLFGFYVQGVVARLSGDSTAEAAARKAFAARYAEEMASARPEYVEHRDLLAAFLEPVAGN
jgi:hypothetical protein